MIEQLKQDTYNFNRIAGTDVETNYQAFYQQYKVLCEEIREVSDALDTRDLTEVVDGVIDTIVVALGMWQKLENLGIDMNKAAELIGHNNLSKYPSLRDDSIVQPTIDKYEAQGIEVTVKKDIPNHCYVFRNKGTGKILKPYGFESVDISSCVPQGVQI